MAQFELRAALIGGRPRRLFLAGYLRRGPTRAGGVGARRCAAERLSAPAARPRVRPPRSPSPPSRPGRPGPVPPARTPAPAPSRAAQCAAGGPVPAGPRAPCPCLPLSGLLQPRRGSASSAPALLRSSVRPPGLLRPRAPRRRASPPSPLGPFVLLRPKPFTVHASPPVLRPKAATWGHGAAARGWRGAGRPARRVPLAASPGHAAGPRALQPHAQGQGTHRRTSGPAQPAGKGQKGLEDRCGICWLSRGS